MSASRVYAPTDEQQKESALLRVLANCNATEERVIEELFQENQRLREDLRQVLKGR